MAPPPEKPALVNPFFTADDLAAINAFNTNFATQFANIDFDLGNLETDTTYQKAQTDKSAKVGAAGATDEMIARGLFRSSIKDAAIYDIEAQRTLQSKFLDDKLTSARLNAGTQKGILSNSKTEFDKAMVGKQAENAKRVNDAAANAWAEAMSRYVPDPPPGPPGPPAKGVARPSDPISHVNTGTKLGPYVPGFAATKPKPGYGVSDGPGTFTPAKPRRKPR